MACLVTFAYSALSRLAAKIGLLGSSGAVRRDPVQRGPDVVRQVECDCGKIFPQMNNGRGTGDQQNIWRAMQQPSDGHLHGRGAKQTRYLRQNRGLQRAKATKREERHIRNAIITQVIDQLIVPAMHEIVVVLHADDLAKPSRLPHLRWNDVAKADRRMRPCYCSSTNTVSGASRAPSAGPCAPNMRRRLTTSSTSMPRLRKLSCTA